MSNLQLERPETASKPETSAPPLPYQGSQLQPHEMPVYHVTPPGVPPPTPIQSAIEDVVSGVEGVGRDIGTALGLNRNQPGYPPPTANPTVPQPTDQQPAAGNAPSYQPPYPEPYQQAGYALSYRTPSTAFLLELLGYVGFLGIGHIYAGNVIGGILMLIFGWSLVGCAYVILSVLSLGLGFILLLPVLLAVPIISGVWAYRIAQANNRRGG